MSSLIGPWASYFIAIAILFFAFSSIIGNYYFGETNIEFIKAHKSWLTIYRVLVLGMIIFGALATVEIVWSMADLFMGLMAIINLFSIFLLVKIAFKVLEDFSKQSKMGLNAVFKASSIPSLKQAECWEDDQKN